MYVYKKQQVKGRILYYVCLFYSLFICFIFIINVSYLLNNF